MSDNIGSVLPVLLDNADLLAEKLGNDWQAVREELVRLISLVYAEDDASENLQAELDTFRRALLKSPAASIAAQLIANAESEDARIITALCDAEQEFQHQLGDQWPLVRADLARLLACLNAQDRSTNLGVELNSVPLRCLRWVG
jgi:hypothetical protein